MTAEPVWGRPCLRLEVPGPPTTTRYLVASELHLGIESELARRGAYLRSQTGALLEALVRDAKTANARRVLILGDVKHKYTHTSRQEQRDVPAFFRGLASEVDEIIITAGNHDTGLRKLLPRQAFPKVRITGSKGTILGTGRNRVAAFHGHARPLRGASSAKLWLVGHTHAAARVVDEQGATTTDWAWLRGHLAFGEGKPSGDPTRVIVFPPYNPLCGGTPINRDGVLGPVGRLLDSGTCALWLLDGRQAVDLAGVPLAPRRGTNRDL